mmetsp:Transcript_10419/g.16894  ORF Transcript_10419/g.16894 Transcript_10419/m.16894 type:complete len:228 (-) Transcript_10419:35-718(-)
MEKSSSSSSMPLPLGNKKARRKGPKHVKPKMTKEERRMKYTALARNRREAHMARKRDKNLICYRCRKTGHSAQNCKEFSDDERNAMQLRKKQGGNICYKCGSTEHRIQMCPKIKSFLQRGKKLDFGKLGDLPYANCYVCNNSGHLASHCPESKKGVYPQGGSCRVCGSVDHYAAECPEMKKGKNKLNDDDDASDASSKSVTIDQYLDEPAVCKKVEKKVKKRKIVNF